MVEGPIEDVIAEIRTIAGNFNIVGDSASVENGNALEVFLKGAETTRWSGERILRGSLFFLRGIQNRMPGMSPEDRKIVSAVLSALCRGFSTKWFNEKNTEDVVITMVEGDPVETDVTTICGLLFPGQAALNSFQLVQCQVAMCMVIHSNNGVILTAAQFSAECSDSYPIISTTLGIAGGDKKLLDRQARSAHSRAAKMKRDLRLDDQRFNSASEASGRLNQIAIAVVEAINLACGYKFEAGGVAIQD